MPRSPYTLVHSQELLIHDPLLFRVVLALLATAGTGGEANRILRDAHSPRARLLARRLVERGVRFIELSCMGDLWDQHENLVGGHRSMSLQVDQPIGGLISDLKSRGLLDETLIIFASEFGRTPFSQGTDGRDHNPFGFSIWMAGGGIQGGTIYGATDEYGYHVVEGRCTVYDVWATTLHLLGIDHKRLTFRHGGRDLRLTDVHGNVLHPIIA